MDNQHRNYGLDIARTTAISLVFCIHAYQNIFSHELPYLWYLAYGGVELFFALSGFLIGKILLELFMQNNGSLSFADLKKFLIRRWLRTLPLYYFILGLLLLMQWLLHEDLPGILRQVFFLNNFLINPPTFFGESWSLAIEEWFYLSFSLMLFLVSFVLLKKNAARTEENNLHRFGYLLLLFVVAAWMIKLAAFLSGNKNELFTIVVYRLDAIGYGIGAYWLYAKFTALKTKAPLILSISVVLVLLAILVRFKFPDSTLTGLSYYLIAGIGYAGIIFSLASGAFRNKWSPISALSKLSYSIYITHLSLILLPMLQLYKPVTVTEKVTFLLAYLVITATVSYCCYRFIEKPFNMLRERIPGLERRSAGERSVL